MTHTAVDLREVAKQPEEMATRMRVLAVKPFICSQPDALSESLPERCIDPRIIENPVRIFEGPKLANIKATDHLDGRVVSLEDIKAAIRGDIMGTINTVAKF